MRWLWLFSRGSTLGCETGDEFSADRLTGVANTSSSSTDNGITSYTWDTSIGYASTKSDVGIEAILLIDGNQVQTPIEVIVYSIVNGQIESETLIGDPDLSGVLLYYKERTYDLSQSYEGCEGSVLFRTQIRFVTTGSPSLDDEYLDDILIEPNSFVSYHYNFPG